MAGILGGIGDKMIDTAVSGLFSALPGFALGTNFAPGGLAIVGERGPELVDLPRGSQVVPNHRMPEAGGVDVRVGVDNNGNLRAFVERTAGMVSARVTQEYDRVLPDRFDQIRRDPRQRG